MKWTQNNINWVEGAKTNYKCHPKNYKVKNSRNIDGLVFHYTGVSHTDHDEGNAQYFSRETPSHTSAHLFVDDDSISQIMRLCDQANHCGATGGLKQKDRVYYNTNTIGIEMCCTGTQNRVSDATKNRAAGLGAWLFILFRWNADEVDTRCRRHWDITGKWCPAQMAGTNNAEWEEFKALIRKKIMAANTPQARPEVSPLIFNSVYYANKYPDLAKAGLKTPIELAEHFINFGMNELRQGCVDFNPSVYKQNNADLRNAFGDDNPMYYWHYVNYGFAEKRVHV